MPVNVLPVVAVTVLNLTPHALNVHDLNGSVTTFPPSGTVARCSSTTTQVGEANGFPLFSTTFGEVVGLPDPQDNVLLVVSALVRQAVPNRKDVASPGELVRDEAGNPVGCKGLTVN